MDSKNFERIAKWSLEILPNWIERAREWAEANPPKLGKENLTLIQKARRWEKTQKSESTLEE